MEDNKYICGEESSIPVVDLFSIPVGVIVQTGWCNFYNKFGVYNNLLYLDSNKRLHCHHLEMKIDDLTEGNVSDNRASIFRGALTDINDYLKNGGYIYN